MNFSNLSKAQLLYSYNAELTFNARVSLLVLYSNFIGVKWEKETLVPRVVRLGPDPGTTVQYGYTPGHRVLILL